MDTITKRLLRLVISLRHSIHRHVSQLVLKHLVVHVRNHPELVIRDRLAFALSGAFIHALMARGRGYIEIHHGIGLPSENVHVLIDERHVLIRQDPVVFEHVGEHVSTRVWMTLDNGVWCGILFSEPPQDIQRQG
jgi:hypothetical protein